MSSRGMSQATIEMSSGRPPETEDTLRGNQGSMAPEVDIPELTENERRVVAEVMDPAADPRRQDIAKHEQGIEELRSRLAAIPNEITALVKTRKPTALLEPEKETKAHIHNMEVDDKIAALRAESENVLDKIHAIERKIAEVQTRIRLQPAAWWLQNETRSLAAVDKVSLLLKTERRKVTSEVKVCEVNLRRQTKRVQDLKMSLSGVASGMKYDAEHPDPLNPQRSRNLAADFRMLTDTLNAETPTLEGLQARTDTLQKRLARVDNQLMQTERTKTLIRCRALWVRYSKLAEELAPVLLELNDMRERFAGSDFAQEINSVAKWPEGHSALTDIGSLPRVYFDPDVPAGDIYSARVSSNYFYAPWAKEVV